MKLTDMHMILSCLYLNSTNCLTKAVPTRSLSDYSKEILIHKDDDDDFDGTYLLGFS